MQVISASGVVNPEYTSLKDPRAKFGYCTEQLFEEFSSSEPNFNVIAELKGEREWQRSAAVTLFPTWDVETHCFLADLEGNKRNFVLTDPQEQISKIISDDKKALRPSKLMTVKCRRVGSTAIYSAHGHVLVSRTPNVKGLVVAQGDDDAKEIFDEKYHYLHANDPLTRGLRRGSTNELYWADTNSKLTVRSAGSRKGLARGSGHVFIHLTECAYYPGPPLEVSATISSLVAGMPKMTVTSDGSLRRAWTLAVAESTGNGMQGWFYEKALRLWNGEQGRVRGEEGDEEDVAGWRLIFLPYNTRWTAKLPFAFDDKGVPLDENHPIYAAKREEFLKTLNEEEHILLTREKHSPEQLHWRRDVFLNEIEGNTPAERLRMLKQEHPATFMDCFQSTGGQAFDTDALNSMLQKATEPVKHGILRPPMYMIAPGSQEAVFHTPKPTFHPKPADKSWYFEWRGPEEGHRYTIGVDTSGGTLRGDWTVCWVFNRDREEFVAKMRSKFAQRELVVPLRGMHARFNQAWVAVESNRGDYVLSALKVTDVERRLYYRQARAAKFNENEKEYGHWTDKYSKPFLVELGNTFIDTHPRLLPDRRAIEEFITFSQELTTKGDVIYPGALPGSGLHDDEADAAMLALVAHHQMPMHGSKPTIETETKTTVAERGARRKSVVDREKEMLGIKEYDAYDPIVDLFTEDWRDSAY